jgi:hypothetical protein
MEVDQMEIDAQQAAPAPQVTEVYNEMKGFVKATHWSKPYYSALIHNNPQLPHHLLEHVNCSYLSTPGRAPNLLVLKQHAQSLAVLISQLAPAQYGGTLPAWDNETLNGDAPFAAHQAFDWLNDLQTHYRTDDSAHQRPLNALVNLIRSNSDTEGPKWHCPLETIKIDLPEKHPFQQYRPYETHITLLMHANEILERLDHEYSAMGGLLGIIPLDSDKVEEQRALKQAKTTLIGQWILYTQHLVVRMHELEIAYGNTLDLLANEVVVPMQHISVHGPDGRSGREIVYPQDRWILANAGEDVSSFIHQMLDRAEAHQNEQDDVFAEQRVLGDAAFSSNEELKYRGIVKVDLNTRFYRLRGSGHGPLFVLPAFGDRPSTRYTRDMENRPTVVTIPEPRTVESVNTWESRHKDVDAKLIRLSIEKGNLEAAVSQNKAMVDLKDREIKRLNDVIAQYDGKLQNSDKDLSQEVVRLQTNIEYYKKTIEQHQEKNKLLQDDLDNFKQANIAAQNGQNPVAPLAERISQQQNELQALKKQLKARDEKISRLELDNNTMRMFSSSAVAEPGTATTARVGELQQQLELVQRERQYLQQEVHTLRTSRAVKGKILNFPDGFKFEYGSTFKDEGQGIIACSIVFYEALLKAERERNELQKKVDEATLNKATQAQIEIKQSMIDHLVQENMRLKSGSQAFRSDKAINVPHKLRHTSTFRDDEQQLIVLTTEWYDHLLASLNNSGNESMQGADIINIPHKLDYGSTFRDDNKGLIVLTTQYYDQLVREDRGGAEAAAASSDIINIPHKLDYGSTFRDDPKGLIVVTTEYYDQLVRSDGKGTGTAAGAPNDYINIPYQLEYNSAFRDDNKKLVVLTTAWYDYLLGEERKSEGQAKDLRAMKARVDKLKSPSVENLSGIYNSLKGKLTHGNVVKDSQAKVAVVTLDRFSELEEAELDHEKTRKSLQECRSRGRALERQSEDLQKQLNQALKRLKDLEGQAKQVPELRRQLDDCLQHRIQADESQSGRPTNRGTDTGTGTGTGDLSEELKSAREEVEILRSELTTVQEYWNDLQTKHLELQAQLDESSLRQELEDMKKDHENLLLKINSDPNNINLAVVAIEAQRNVARKERNELREEVKTLRERLRNQM